MSDLVDKRTVLKAIGRLYVKQYTNTDLFDDGWNASLDMAKETVEQLPPANTSEIPNSSDCISRQAAIDAIHCDITVTGRQNAELVAATIGAFADRIKALPSAQPEIIRCKDCLMHGVCRFERGLGLDGYCSQAERRTDG